MSGQVGVESSARSRTRAAILAATASALAANPTATLDEITAVAGIGRTTLHRYFPSRTRLLHAAAMNSAAVVTDVVAQAVTDQGPALEAVRRLVFALVPVGDHLVFLLGAPKGLENIAPGDRPTHRRVTHLIQRGHREGVFHSDFSPRWVQRWLLTLLLAGCQEVSICGLPLHTAAPLILRTFERGIAADRDC
ncbi:TetR/AcrR family transcriptional regulator [Mycolicibacterium novocastrense]|uniref:TetR/AcrR family transcriptional regulator n=1 Tax=Mycolicibacterium novocastrense TaxID=59813 RepID=UPI000AA3F878|nr:TetR/AcrR family transcriptional regulator [Mycolicibacterium novocastrense]